VELQIDGTREGTTLVALVEAAQVVGDGAIVAGGVLEYRAVSDTAPSLRASSSITSG
jgi:hypothetical protein